jgi:hypothetical protein
VCGIVVGTELFFFISLLPNFCKKKMFQISQRYSDGDLVEKLREGNVFFYEFKSDWKGAC